MFNTILENMERLPVVTARQKGATEIRVFVTDEEKEALKEVASKENIAVSHLARALLLAWVDEKT